MKHINYNIFQCYFSVRIGNCLSTVLVVRTVCVLAILLAVEGYITSSE